MSAVADPDGAWPSSESDNSHPLACADCRALTSPQAAARAADTMWEVSASPVQQRPAPDHLREATQDAPIGGQAVLEGVMMRGISTWAVAVRKPTPEQLAAGGADPRRAPRARSRSSPSRSSRGPSATGCCALPVVRGVVALVESLKIGFRALDISANAQMPRDEQGEQQEIGGGAWIGHDRLRAAVRGRPVLPAARRPDQHLQGRDPQLVVFVVIEKLVRITIFLGYLLLISRMPDLQRVFEYHGAEHKTISCYEAGLELTPENAQRFSRFHPRCGTSFLLLVMIVAIFVFAPLGKLDWHWLFLSRVRRHPDRGRPRLRGDQVVRSNRTKRWARVLMWPGLQLQRLTTREPDLAQLAVAIAALEAVLEVEDPRAAERGRQGGHGSRRLDRGPDAPSTWGELSAG